MALASTAVRMATEGCSIPRNRGRDEASRRLTTTADADA
jgi:hypothetical protein